MTSDTWLYNGIAFDECEIENKKLIGFVYKITNLIDGRIYIGKKLFTFSKRKQVKGKKKKFKVSSDWKVYFGSSEELLEDVKKLSEENFKREILHLCISKAQMSYLELREQMDNRVLETDKSYNAWIFVKIRKAHLKSLY